MCTKNDIIQKINHKFNLLHTYPKIMCYHKGDLYFGD